MSRLRRVLLMAVLGGCGGAPEFRASLDWSVPADPTAAPPVSPPKLEVAGTRLLEGGGGRAVRLRGVNVCSLEFDREGAGWKLTPDGGSGVLDVLADPTRWSANAVRVPVNQQWFVEDEAYVARIEQIIDAAAARGLYVLLDVQWEVGMQLEPYHRNILPVPTFGPGNTTEAFWYRATGRWSNRSNLLYDLINEPHDRSDADTAEAMQELVDAIRRRDPATVIVIGGTHWAHSVEAWRRSPLSGANLIYSAHQYLPYDRPEDFDRNFAAAASEIPVLVGEFLADEANAGYAAAVIDQAEAAGVNGWLPWAIGCGFDEHDDLRRDPFSTIARRMRELR